MRISTDTRTLRLPDFIMALNNRGLPQAKEIAGSKGL